MRKPWEHPSALIGFELEQRVRGYEHCRFSDLAQRTCRFADASRP